MSHGRLEIDRGRLRAEKPLSGECLLLTIDSGLSAEYVATDYKELAEAEAAFRPLEQSLDLCPPSPHREPDHGPGAALLAAAAAPAGEGDRSGLETTLGRALGDVSHKGADRRWQLYGYDRAYPGGQGHTTTCAATLTVDDSSRRHR